MSRPAYRVGPILKSTPTPEQVERLRTNFGSMPVLLLLDRRLSAHAKLCYGVMSSFGLESRAGLKTIALRMSASESTARRARKELETHGWITFIKVRVTGVLEWQLNGTHVPPPEALSGLRGEVSE